MNIWKVSHSPSDINDAVNDWLNTHHYIAVNKKAKKGQAAKFADEINIGDLIHLNRGNHSVGLFVVGSNLTTHKKSPLGASWFLRSVKPVKLTNSDAPYIGPKKGWTPNYNSACYKVPSWDLAEFELQILKPNYALTLAKLEPMAIKASAAPLVQAESNAFFLEHPAPANASRKGKSKVKAKPDTPTAPLNQILYGPVGTGKTLSAMQQALTIIDPSFAAANSQNPKAIQRRLEELMQEKRISLVSFHPHFGYDDFVEGMKASTDENNALTYHVEDGIFKRIADEACKGVGFKDPLQAAIQILIEKQEQQDARLTLTTKQGKQFEIEYEGGKTFKVFPESMETANTNYVASISNVKKLYETGNKQGIYNPSYVDGLLRFLQSECGLEDFESGEVNPQASQPFVLIIDEIHRGDIARIFGELLSIIEPSKRAGCAHATHITLPYSKESFSVPANLHIIGTMNSTDCNISTLPSSILRRFELIEIAPNYAALEALPSINGIQICPMVKAINQRIELLLDKSHVLGHSLFMTLNNTPTLEHLSRLFQHHVVPLLLSHFKGDWDAVSKVLGDHLASRSPSTSQQRFITKTFDDDAISQLMGSDWESMGMNIGINAYDLNTQALQSKQAFINIYAR